MRVQLLEDGFEQGSVELSGGGLKYFLGGGFLTLVLVVVRVVLQIENM